MAPVAAGQAGVGREVIKPADGHADGLLDSFRVEAGANLLAPAELPPGPRFLDGRLGKIKTCK